MSISFSDFTWFSLKPKPKMQIIIKNEKQMQFNPMLMERIPDHVMIGLLSDENKVLHIGIRSDVKKESVNRIAKSGTVKSKEILDVIKAFGTHFPAKFTVAAMEDGWIGTMEADDASPHISKTKKPPLAKKQDHSNLDKELKDNESKHVL